VVGSINNVEKKDEECVKLEEGREKKVVLMINHRHRHHHNTTNYLFL
jgi:hypothetical protein